MKRTLGGISLLVSLALGCGDDGKANPVDAGGGADATTDSHADTGPAPDASDAGVVGPFGNDVPVSGFQAITGLQGPVDVVRDKNGMVHIYGTTTVDVLRVEGYQVARDRTMQLELFRRLAEGSLSEYLPGQLAGDIATRAIGLKRTGQAMYDMLPMGSAARAGLDAYADGISQFNARVIAGTETLPKPMVGIPVSALGPWTGADVLAMARFQEFSLSYFGGDELYATAFVLASNAKFNATATDPALKARAGFLIDSVRFDTIDTTTVLPQFPDDAALTGRGAAPGRSGIGLPMSGGPRGGPIRSPKIDPGALAALRPFRDALKRVRSVLGDAGAIGSNDWVVGPQLTATGHTMVASDPHLQLYAPPIFWMVHLDVINTDPKEALDCAGLSFPGIAGIILGFNQHIGWGATDAYYDVSDTYQETVTADGKGVVFNGQPVAFATAKEIIPIGSGKTYEYDVQIVPHHGPILPTLDASNHVVPAPAGGTAMSERWTGMDVTDDSAFLFGLARAASVEDFRTAVRSFATGAENWAVGDDQGNVFYSAQANIPKRDKRAFTWDPSTFTGTLPYFVLPGDGTAEWTGSLEEKYVPHKKNPTTSFIVTANNQQVPRPVANDPSSLVLPNGAPIFLGAEYDKGYRAGRVTQRITQVGHKITLDDMASFQADTRSPYGAALTPSLGVALQHAAQEKATPGTHPDLTAIVADPRYAALPADVGPALAGWQAAGYDAASGVDPDTNKPVADPSGAAEAAAIFNVWFTRMLGAVFADELAAIGQTDLPLEGQFSLAYLLTAPDPTKFATYDATLKDSILFDDLTTTTVTESRDQRAILSLLDAVDFLKQQLGADSTMWRWGSLHTLRFDSVFPLWSVALSIPGAGDKTFPNGFPRHGDTSTVDVGGFSMPVTLGPLPKSTYFGYSHGPTQRFVIDLDPAGPVARNALPGGEIWDNTSPHFRDEAEYWRKNQNHSVPFAKPDVVAAAESHVVYTFP